VGILKRPLPSIDVRPDFRGISTIPVSPDIVAVPRPSAPRVRKRTPWRPQPDGQVTTARAGHREWFSDRLFVESQDGHARSGYSASLVAHVCGSAALIAFLITRPVQPIVVRVAALVMPVMVSPLPAIPVADTPVLRTVERPHSNAPAGVTAPAPAPPPADDVAVAAAPVEAPSGITPETGAENRVAGVEGGVPGGIAGGVVGGTGNAPSAAGRPGPIVMRVGTAMKAPRKIKHVKPEYPPSALPMRAQGAVLIEALIGTDGKVQSATVLHSVPALDQAALDAVRRWEYEPSFLNGAPVAVMMTVVVNFALQ